MNRQRIVRYAAFVVVAAIYIAARFWNLTASCLWFDEIFSVHAAEHSWSSILNFVALDLIHPPLFYLVLKMWTLVGGESLFWLRGLPFAFSVIAIVPFALLARELRLGVWTTVLAFFLIAVNGSLIKYAQEVRMYSMLMCMSLFSIWLFARYFQKGKAIVGLTLVNVVLIYTHYFGWLVVLSEITAIFAFQRIKWRPISLMAVVTAACFTPWFVAVLFAAETGSQLSQNIGWMQRPGIFSLAQLALDLVEPFYYSATSIDPVSVYRISIPLLLIAVVSLCLYFARTGAYERSASKPAKLLMIFIAIPLAIAFVASWILPYSVWGTRHLVIVFTPFSLLIAISLSRVSDLSIKIAALTLVILFAGYAFLLEANRPKHPPIWCGFESIAKTLQADERGPIYVFEDLAAYHLWFEFRQHLDAKSRQRVVKVDDFPGMLEDKSYFIPRGLNDEYLMHGSFYLDSGAFQGWIVYRAPDLNLTKPPLDTLTDHRFRITRQEIYNGGDTKIIALLLEKE